MKPDFSGWATKANLKCSDGRTITDQAFAHMDGMKVPLVWQHVHGEVENILGYGILTHKAGEGVWVDAFFNKTPKGLHAKGMVEHGDIDLLSIFANNLVEKSKSVLHGMIREVSLVIAAANPGARIENVRIAHSSDPDDVQVLADEVIITTGLSFAHSDEGVSTEGVSHDVEDGDEELTDEQKQEALESLTDEQKVVIHDMLSTALQLAADGDEEDALQHADGTLKDVYDSFTPIQLKLVHYMIGTAVEAAQADSTAAHSGTDTDEEGNLIHQEGTTMRTNIFEQNGAAAGTGAKKTLTHSEFAEIANFAKKDHDGSLKAAMLAHAGDYGIDDIDFLFPDAKALANSPELHSRRMDWVAKVLDGTKHSPFAKVKSLVADITADEARARGYVKGNKKVHEVFGLLKRTTSPTTIYKLQKLDRDDIVDITDMDVVAFLKAEMRHMIEEEVARAILVGDGRTALNPAKVKDPEGSIDGVGIRSILKDDEFYAPKHNMPANTGAADAVKQIVRARSKWRGSGTPTLFISDNALTDIMLLEDKFGRERYADLKALQDKVRVSAVVTVDLFDEYDGLFAILVNLADYTIGANKGGELTSFEDFDLNYNQYEYLTETRISGALTKPFSAIVIMREEGMSVTPVAPSFNGATNTVTLPATTGVVYEITDEPVAAGDVVIDRDAVVEAKPDDGYYFPYNTPAEWTYTYTP
jgi:hypothetical protein